MSRKKSGEKHRKPPKINYVKNIVVVHGKSEQIICEYIKSNLRLPIEIYSHNNGKNNIEISSINSVLNNTIFKDRNSLEKNYYITEEKQLSKDDLQLFVIMDKDRCEEKLFSDYKDKTMFEKHWMYNLITPIYNIESLEDVLSKAGYKDLRKSKKDYIKLFPINRGEYNLDEIKDLHENLLKVKRNSNLHLFIEKCINMVETP